MNLGKIMEGIDFVTNKDISNINIVDIAYDSRKAKENYIFVCLVGETVDGHEYANKAYENGCRVFLVQHDIDLGDDVVILKVDNSRIGLSKISANFFGNPSKQLEVIGVTGTKGKTTITNYISGVLNNAGFNTGVIGTNGIFYNNTSERTANTTPESYELQKTFRKMLDEGVKCVAMEVSSGGLMMYRVNDVDFDIGIFSNLSLDHVGPKEHPTFEHYLNCKAMLFKMCKHGIINMDDEYANDITKDATCDIETYGFTERADIYADYLVYSRDANSLGTRFIGNVYNKKLDCFICSPGSFSVYNALAVIAVCNYLKIDEEIMLDALNKTSVDGRVELVDTLPYCTAVIDYAHNGVSLESLLDTLKLYDPKRLICVFGSVGGRTKLRRKELGDVAAKKCDFAILTEDNPDFEDPFDICIDIAKSFENSDCEYEIIPDRAKAIEYALNIAKEGDLLVFAGKGHEDYQLIKGEKVYYSEKETILKKAEEIKKAKGIKIS